MAEAHSPAQLAVTNVLLDTAPSCRCSIDQNQITIGCKSSWPVCVAHGSLLPVR